MWVSSVERKESASDGESDQSDQHETDEAQQESAPVRMSLRGAPSHLRQEIVRAQNAAVRLFRSAIILP